MLITIGQVGAPHGVKGEFRVHPVTDFPERFTHTEELYVVRGVADGEADAAAAKYRVRLAHPTGGGPWIMALDGVNTRNEAAALLGALLKVPEEELTPLPEGHFYLFQIVGLDVLTADGRTVGKVADVLKYQANDVYVIRPAAKEGAKQSDYLVPAIHEAVAEIDVKGGRLVLRRHPGEAEEA